MLLLICGSCFLLIVAEDDGGGRGVYDTLRGFMNELGRVVRDVTSGIEKLGQGIKNVEDFLDATVEEDCVFECPNGN